MAIRSSGLDYKALAAYLCKGVTWSRLREIATKDPRDGGLGLFKDSSQQCKNLFGKSPSAIIVTRPDSDLRFLKLLEGKEHLLHRLAVKDLEQSLVELHQIFLDMAVLVEAQGEMLDNIEKQVREAGGAGG